MLKRLFCLTLLSFTFLSFADEGADLFQSNKCTKCHAVESHKIATTSDKDPSEVKDLSKSGANFDAAKLTAYLKKEIDIEGEKHKLKFKGDEAELKKIVDWVLTLK